MPPVKRANASYSYENTTLLRAVVQNLIQYKTGKLKQILFFKMSFVKITLVKSILNKIKC